MSNKKLFWIAFFTLSFCEFGQFAYSKNTTVTTEQSKHSSETLGCDKTHTSVNDFDSNAELISYSLPR